jgi:hypothetical protein
LPAVNQDAQFPDTAQPGMIAVADSLLVARLLSDAAFALPAADSCAN